MLALCPLNLVLEFRKLSRHPAVLPPILLHIQSTQWPLTSTTTGPESRFRFPSKPNFFQAPLNAKPHVKWSPNPGTIDNKAHVTDHTHQQPMKPVAVRYSYAGSASITCLRIGWISSLDLRPTDVQFGARGTGTGAVLHELVAFNAADRGVGSGWTEERESLLAFRCELSPSRCYC
ncbi:hypothetical protein FJTKL_13388 [Diaporthe vaccinii]|uniref:Uncharacterized protein n=1 Tax=Diaporthe vaccinii TaxID=105482 RepID=A0ABR4EAS5_9PEZI